MKRSVEAVEKVPKQILGRGAEKSDIVERATINYHMLAKGQEVPGNVPLTPQKDFSCRLVMCDKKMKDKDLTAYCGLYCGDCIRFKCRASNLSALLLDELERSHFHEYSKVKRSRAKELDHYESMITALKTISAIKCEVPCRLGGDGCNGTCQISKCVKDKAIEGCWECTEFEACNKLDFLKPFHGDTPIKNLRNIRKFGIDSWAKYREKCYPWL